MKRNIDGRILTGKIFSPIIYLASNFILSIIILVILWAINISLGDRYFNDGIDSVEFHCFVNGNCCIYIYYAYLDIVS